MYTYTHAPPTSCSPCPSLADYGNKISKHALKVSVVLKLALYERRTVHGETMLPLTDFFVIVTTVLNQFLSLALSWFTIGRLLKNVSKPARNLALPAKMPDGTRHW